MRGLASKAIFTLVFGLTIYSLILLRINGEAFRLAIIGSKRGQTDYSGQAVYQDHANNNLEKVHSSLERPSQSTSTALSAKDVLLIMRTSSSTIWRRLPIHLSTLFTSTPNFVIYSDFPETIAGLPVIDAFQYVSKRLKSSEDFKTYRQIHDFRNKYPSRYWEGSSLEGDWLHESANSWAIDKYKFLPVLQHVYETNSGFKWYVMIEDDSFLFWNNLLGHLRGLSHLEPYWLGHSSFRLGEPFAHGGAGMVFSQAALEKTFMGEEDLARKTEKFTEEHHVGDHVLGHVLAQKNLLVNGNGSFTWSFEDEAPWRINFNQENWNQKLFSLHHVHQRDISQLWEFEREHETSRIGSLTYGHLFESFVLPFIDSEKSSWDCLARKQASLSTAENPSLGDKAAFSKEGCYESCVEWENCLMWKRDESYGCFQDFGVGLGKAVEDDNASHMTSGWMIERINKLRHLN